ncbi:glycosyl transferase, group 1 family protein [Flavobacterium cauense R2A-7]|uniref:Glycosyltransferase involved in cell wall biosynthesis n=1 Tax=Flavobacterium cauense R2A-7 TaxID=1341154 RepID=V6S256_9FLAO|nr:glycosyltransferase family 4 protein [Flavobacterium cauense]ESU20781.1 glycosyl transferase, group 1 family protein [Flavobacterium cauense R2A-7]KGO82850.1 glycosyl transferase family 1 [Flavobacterium cauense R2A-7]TWI12120.1 glycosyltransferase involved in cell wall biosynthesis [Flavobacterium cauense R2A-7]
MKNLLYIGNKLSGKGLNTTIIETLSAQFTKEGYRVVAVSGFKNPVLRMLDMLLAVIRYRKSDFVLIDTYSTSGFWFAFSVSQLCRLFGKKYIPILHGGNLPNRLQNNPKLCTMVFGNAYKNVAPSHYLLEAFKKAGFSNLVFIPNTLEIGQYPFLERTELQPKLLWVRAFDAIYNPKMAIDVLSLLQKKFPEAQLCMVGPDRDGSMESCKDYALEKNVAVHFTGRLPKTEWIALAAAYDIFINTTHFDNTPVSVMEAMALGLPVVTTNVGGIPFLLKNNQEAMLVADNDFVGMVDAIVSLIENPQTAKEMARKARIKAESWDWNVVKDQWKNLLS